MWSEDLHWAWKLREQKRKRDEIKNSTNPSVLESKELFELYATDLGQEIEMEQTPLNLITKEKWNINIERMYVEKKYLWSGSEYLLTCQSVAHRMQNVLDGRSCNWSVALSVSLKTCLDVMHITFGSQVTYSHQLW